MRNLIATVVSLFLITISTAPANAALIPLQAILDCAAAAAGESTCGAGGSGTGFASATLDDATNLFSWEITRSGLSSAATASHFHGPALSDAGAAPAVNISVASNPAIGSTTITAVQISDLFAVLWYVSQRTFTEFFGGEIRGQVNGVPLAVTGWSFGSALGLLGWLRKRAKRVNPSIRVS